MLRTKPSPSPLLPGDPGETGPDTQDNGKSPLVSLILCMQGQALCPFQRQKKPKSRWRWSDGDGCSSIPGPETLTLIVMREKPALKAAGDPGASPSGCNSHRCGRFVKLPYCLLCPSGGQGNELLEACCSLATLMNKDTQAAWDCLEQQSEALIPPSTLPPEWGETRASH